MERSGWNYPSGDIRLSDADRDRALAELHEALRDGRITADEFDERSAQALASRTGLELTALLADLPPDSSPAARATVMEPAGSRVLASRIATVGSAAAAVSLAAVALSNGLSHGPDLAQRELARQVLARQGLSIPLPPNPGFDWAGTITPAAIAVLLLVLLVVLQVKRARSTRPGIGRLASRQEARGRCGPTRGSVRSATGPP
jgi:hypothetical protein